jgi:calcineurin-like phosphoesterase family protein
MAKKIYNHVIYALDVSGSMAHNNVISHAKNVLQAGLDAMKAVSAGSGQETLVSLYTFNHEVSTLFIDRPVEEVSLNNVTFRADGGTALIDAAMKTMLDGLTVQVKNKKTESHAYLLNVITDGDERHSKNKVDDLRKIISKLNDEWTIAVQVPDQQGVHFAKLCGFPAGNIAVWKAGSKEGLEESVREFSKDYDELYIDNQFVVLFHYPMRQWNKCHHGSIACFGHVHNGLEPYGKSVDVGVDSTWVTGKAEYRPFSFQEIKRFMDKQPIIAHHGD